MSVGELIVWAVFMASVLGLGFVLAWMLTQADRR